jgi:hypothetical protein
MPHKQDGPGSAVTLAEATKQNRYANRNATVVQLHAPRAGRHRTYTGDPAGLLLSLLEGVRVTGKGWMARCPAHADKSASLSLATGTDGRCLIHCHAGCGAAAVIAAVGLELADLFPQRLGPLTPQGRRELSDTGRLARRIAALNAIAHELAVIEVAAGRLAADPDSGLDWADYQRVCTAHQRIAAARREVAQ